DAERKEPVENPATAANGRVARGAAAAASATPPPSAQPTTPTRSMPGRDGSVLAASTVSCTHVVNGSTPSKPTPPQKPFLPGGGVGPKKSISYVDTPSLGRVVTMRWSKVEKPPQPWSTTTASRVSRSERQSSART